MYPQNQQLSRNHISILHWTCDVHSSEKCENIDGLRGSMSHFFLSPCSMEEDTVASLVAVLHNVVSAKAQECVHAHIQTR